MKLICRRALLLLMLLCAVTAYSKNNQSLKREFRGAWIQAVNGQFLNMQPDEMRAYLTDMLDNLQLANVNAIIFQVRVEGDALYDSQYEPWSRYLTGVQGVPPGWDPLEFMGAEAH